MGWVGAGEAATRDSDGELISKRLRPHSLQNLLPGKLAVPQVAQLTLTASDAPHSRQNLALSGFATPHCGHSMPLPFQRLEVVTVCR